jgi:hypothetical protein
MGGQVRRLASRDDRVDDVGAGGELNPACILSDVRIAARLFALADRLMRHHYPRPFAGKAAE